MCIATRTRIMHVRLRLRAGGNGSPTNSLALVTLAVTLAAGLTFLNCVHVHASSSDSGSGSNGSSSSADSLRLPSTPSVNSYVPSEPARQKYDFVPYKNGDTAYRIWGRSSPSHIKTGDHYNSRQIRHAHKRIRRHRHKEGAPDVLEHAAVASAPQSSSSDSSRSPAFGEAFDYTISYDIDLDHPLDTGDMNNLTSTSAQNYTRTTASAEVYSHAHHKKKTDQWLFFTLTLSFFSLIGIVLFIRRCVKCPHSPAAASVLGRQRQMSMYPCTADKELPPVEYSAIPMTSDGCNDEVDGDGTITAMHMEEVNEANNEDNDNDNDPEINEFAQTAMSTY